MKRIFSALLAVGLALLLLTGAQITEILIILKRTTQTVLLYREKPFALSRR